jgi:ABC-type ATPase involved in cell division
MIRFEHVSKRYEGGGDALKDISFTLEAGEIAFVTGHSGAGKSTLLKLIAGIEKPSRGQAMVNGQNLARLSRRRLPYYRRGIGIIFQDHKLLPELSVADNVALPLIVAWPRLGFSMPAISFSRVLLPAPEWPVTKAISPASSVKLMSLRASPPPS